MQRSKLVQVTNRLLRQFWLTNLKHRMADGTESTIQMTEDTIPDNPDSDIFHDIECPEICMLIKVVHVDGRNLPVGSFTEGQVIREVVKRTGLEPPTVTLLGPKRCLIEFPKGTEVVSHSFKFHGPSVWDDLNVEMSCWMSTRNKLLEIYQESDSMSKEREEIRKEREQLHLERLQHETQLGQVVAKIGNQLEQMEKRPDSEAPTIPSGILTPTREAGSPRSDFQPLVMAPGLPLFSGTEPIPRDEGSYEQWKFQVRGMKSSCPEAAVRSALIASVRGEASSLVSFVGFNAPLGMILEAMEKRFGKVPTTDRLQQEFFQLQQDKGERVQHFAGRLEKTFKRLQEVFPDRYGEIQLKERLFHGVNQQTRDSMRFLYTKESTTYDSLLAAIKEAESEWNESKSQLRVKSAVVCDREDQMEELKKRLDKLTATVKSSNVKEKPKGNKNKTSGDSPRKDEKRKLSRGPATTSAGPFKPSQRTIQCYKCEGWGHGWRECATKGNVDWGRVREEPTPIENPTPENAQQ